MPGAPPLTCRHAGVGARVRSAATAGGPTSSYMRERFDAPPRSLYLFGPAAVAWAPATAAAATLLQRSQYPGVCFLLHFEQTLRSGVLRQVIGLSFVWRLRLARDGITVPADRQRWLPTGPAAAVPATSATASMAAGTWPLARPRCISRSAASRAATMVTVSLGSPCEGFVVATAAAALPPPPPPLLL